MTLAWLGVLALAGAAAAAEPPAPRDVTIAAPDGVALKATYFAASTPGPAVLLLHMCNTTRASWEPVARRLSAAGIHALTLDYRGFGESAGPRFGDQPPPDRLRIMAEQWPGDIDAALTYLLSQPGVDKARVGAGGGSCGVNQAVQVARRHREVISLVLLAGPTDGGGLQFLRRARWLPIFASAAADDRFDREAPRSMRWITEVSGSPRNRFVGFPDGGHGTDIFGPHPELVQQIADWYVETLVTAPADPEASVTPRKTPASEFWAAIDEPGGIARAVDLFHEARRSNPRAFLFPEQVMNQAAYERLQAGQSRDAVALFELNVEAYPASANARDSLSDGCLADGQKARALAAAHKALELLPADPIDPAFKESIRKSAEQKIAAIEGSPSP